MAGEWVLTPELVDEAHARIARLVEAALDVREIPEVGVAVFFGAVLDVLVEARDSAGSFTLVAELVRLIAAMTVSEQPDFLERALATLRDNITFEPR